MAKKTEQLQTLQELQEQHSELCARAFEQGVDLPEDLTVDFESVESGAAICAAIDDLIRARGLAGGAEEVHSGETDKSPPKSKPKKPRAADAAATTQESDMAKVAKKAKKAKTVKKVAKAAKGVAKKGTAKKVRNGEGKTAKLVAKLKDGGCTREQALKMTGWKALSFQQLAKAQGLKLKIDDSERPFKYRAA